MFGLTKLRGYFIRRAKEERAAEQRRSKSPEIYSVAKEPDDIKIYSVEEQAPKFIWGIFPIFWVKAQTSRVIWSLKETVSPAMAMLVQGLKMLVSDFDITILQAAFDLCRDHFSANVSNAKKRLSKKVRADYKALHEKFIANLLAENQRKFRESLIATIGKSTFATAKKMVQTRLAEMALVIEERIAEKAKLVSSSGPLALPEGTRFAYNKEDVSVYVLEMVPQLRTIFYRHSTYRLSFPYIVFFITLKKGSVAALHMFYRNEALVNEDDRLYQSNMPNTHSDFRICFTAPKKSGMSPPELAEKVLEAYWRSSFNDDLTEFFREAGKIAPAISSFDNWQRASGNNQRFITGIEWKRTEHSVRSMVNHLIAVYSAKGKNDTSNPINKLGSHIEGLARKVAESITENAHFMTAHATNDIESLKPAQEALAEVLKKAADEFDSALDQVTTIKDARAIRALLDKLKLKMVESIDEQIGRAQAHVNQSIPTL